MKIYWFCETCCAGNVHRPLLCCVVVLRMVTDHWPDQLERMKVHSRQDPVKRDCKKLLVVTSKLFPPHLLHETGYCACGLECVHCHPALFCERWNQCCGFQNVASSEQSVQQTIKIDISQNQNQLLHPASVPKCTIERAKRHHHHLSWSTSTSRC